MKLIEQLIQQGYLKSPPIIDAFRKIKRADFISDEIKREQGDDFINEYNAPISIDYGQTISQPLTVAFMLELLKPQEGDKILDIGSGSGWQTALLCEIIGEKGIVYAVEIIPELKNFGQDNVSKYSFVKKGRANFICGDGADGLPDQSPFDKIVVSATAEKIFITWKDQLKIGGRLVAPIKNSLWLLTKEGENDFVEKEYPGFSFVPLVSKKL
jgi:protein-L-isoaspartate(D-aspartate) O-methyltransferase